jgi:hypothetical protein
VSPVRALDCHQSTIGEPGVAVCAPEVWSGMARSGHAGDSCRHCPWTSLSLSQQPWLPAAVEHDPPTWSA